MPEYCFSQSNGIFRCQNFAMSSSGKFVLCLAVVFCFVQTISARPPRFDGNFFENVKYDLVKKCTSEERDIEKDYLNIKHKVTKDAAKLMKKALKEGSPECIENAKLQAEEGLDEKSQEALDCIRELRESLDGAVDPSASLNEVLIFRNDFKNKLKGCKNTGKVEMKAIQNNFQGSGKACLY